MVFQAVEIMAEPWGLSPAFQRAVLLVLVMGLSVTLVLSWYHGEKGRQRVSGPELLLIALLFVIAGGGLYFIRDSSADGVRQVAERNRNWVGMRTPSIPHHWPI